LPRRLRSPTLKCQAMTMTNLSIFHQKDKDGALPLHYAARSESVEALSTSTAEPSATRALAKPALAQPATPLFHVVASRSYDAEHCLCSSASWKRIRLH
jgi:ankyrin repeat protein